MKEKITELDHCDNCDQKHLGDLYRYGDEKRGIFINYYTAKIYYDKAGEDFDPQEAERKNLEKAAESEPTFATFRLEGSSVSTLKGVLQKIFGNLSEYPEQSMGLPIRAVTKATIGSDAYVGYIQAIDEVAPDAIKLEVEFYGCHPLCLKYALSKAFHYLNVEFVEHEKPANE